MMYVLCSYRIVYYSFIRTYITFIKNLIQNMILNVTIISIKKKKKSIKSNILCLIYFISLEVDIYCV